MKSSQVRTWDGILAVDAVPSIVILHCRHSCGFLSIDFATASIGRMHPLCNMLGYSPSQLRPSNIFASITACILFSHIYNTNMFDLSEIPTWAWVLIIILCIILALCVARVVHVGFTGGGLWYDSEKTKTILKAMKNHDLAGAEKMFGVEGDDRLFDYDRNTVLHLAAKVGNIDIIGILLKKINTFHQNDLGQTPLHIAAIHNNAAAFEALIRYIPLGVYIRDKKGKLAWESANIIMRPKFQKLTDDTVRDMIKKDSAKAKPDALIQSQLDAFLVGFRDVSMCATDGRYNIMHFAVEHSIWPLLNALMFAGARVDTRSDRDHNILWYAVRGKTLDPVYRLGGLGLIVKLIKHEKNIIFDTIQYDNIDAFKFIERNYGICMEAKVNGNTYVHFMAIHASKTFIQECMPADRKLLFRENNQYHTPVYYAFMREHEIAEACYKKLGPDVIFPTDVLMQIIKDIPEANKTNINSFFTISPDGDEYMNFIKRVPPGNADIYLPYLEERLLKITGINPNRFDRYKPLVNLLNELLPRKHLHKLYTTLRDMTFSYSPVDNGQNAAKGTLFDGLKYGFKADFTKHFEFALSELQQDLEKSDDVFRATAPSMPKQLRLFMILRAKWADCCPEVIQVSDAKKISCTIVAAYLGMDVEEACKMDKPKLCKWISEKLQTILDPRLLNAAGK
jgi:Ankyrin repeats (3 copies)